VCACVRVCVCVSYSGTHEKLVLEAGILEKLIETVIEMSENDKENVSVNFRACFRLRLNLSELSSTAQFPQQVMFSVSALISAF